MKNIEKCSVEDLYELFEIMEINDENLKVARKKVLLLHPDKNIGVDTSEYYEYFKLAYLKLEKISQFVNHDKKIKTYYDPHVEKDDVTQEGFYKYCKKEKLHENPKEFHKKFNEVFENVNIKDETGHGEWIKSEKDMYDKDDLEGSRKKALQIVVKEDIKSYVETDNKDLKDVYTNTILSIDKDQVFNDTRKFKSVDEYQRHRKNTLTGPTTKEEAEEILRQKQNEEHKSAITLSYELLKKTEESNKKFKEYCSKFLMIR
jgi:hypothetical protein